MYIHGKAVREKLWFQEIFELKSKKVYMKVRLKNWNLFDGNVRKLKIGNKIFELNNRKG